MNNYNGYIHFGTYIMHKIQKVVALMAVSHIFRIFKKTN